jgi:plasmid stability protein
MAIKKSPQKGVKATVHKVVLYMPADLHKDLKVRAAEEETTMSAYVNTLLKEALKKGDEKKK